MLEASLIGEVPARAARTWSHRTVVIFEGRRISYEDLARGAASLASLLADLGVAPGERAALLMENRPEYLHAYFAVPAAGAVLVPLNTFLAVAELRAILRDGAVSVLIVSDAWLSRVASVLPQLPDLTAIILCGSRDEASSPPVLPPGIRVARHAGVPAGLRDEAGHEENHGRARSIAARAEDAAVIIYTSGTTGAPKGVMLSHHNLLANASACIDAVGVSERDRILVALPLFHSFTQMVGLLAPVLAGMSILLCERLDRAEIKRAIVRHRPTIFPAVPAVFAAMAHARVSRLGRWLNPVRLYISGGAPLSLDTLRRFEELYRRPLCEGYGLSEASPVVALNPPAGPRKPGSVGRPLRGVEVRVVDSDNRSLPCGETGELLVRAPSVMMGYHRRAEATASALNGGWLRTGDLARVDEGGYLFIMGRLKEMLIFRGMNVYPREIEEMLESHPAVKEAAVIGIPDAARGEVPHAFVAAQPGQNLSAPELRRFCLDRLARYKVPRSFTMLEQLPRNPAGKIVKELLKEQGVPQPSG